MKTRTTFYLSSEKMALKFDVLYYVKVCKRLYKLQTYQFRLSKLLLLLIKVKKKNFLLVPNLCSFFEGASGKVPKPFFGSYWLLELSGLIDTKEEQIYQTFCLQKIILNCKL